MEHPRRGPRGRRFPDDGRTTGRAATRSTATARSSGSCPRWTGWRCVQISARFLSQDERIEIADLRHAGLSVRQIAAPAGPGTVDDLAGAAPQRDREPAAIGRSRLTVARPRAGPAVIGDASRPTASSGSWSASCWRSGGARSRSAATCGCGSPTSRRCGCVTRASTRPSTSPDRRCCDRRRWLRTTARRCAPDVITAARISAPTGAGRGSSSRCSRSTSGPSSPRTAPRPGTGRAI